MLGRHLGQFLLGDPGEVEGTQEHVGLHLILSEHLGETPAADVAPEVHLPEAVLGMGISLGEEEVMGGLRVDVRHPIDVPDHLDLVSEARHLDLAVGLGKRAADHEEAEDPNAYRQHQEEDQDAANPAHGASLGGIGLCPRSCLAWEDAWIDQGGPDPSGLGGVQSLRLDSYNHVPRSDDDGS